MPNSIPALIAKIVESLTWDKTLQVAFLIGVIAIAVSLVLVVLTYTLSAVPPIWSAIVSLIVGGGAVTITYRRTTLPPHHAAPGGDARGRPGIVEVDCSCGCDVSDFSPSG